MQTRSANKSAIDAAVRAYASDIRARYEDVIKIIWFGSWIHGIPLPSSDVDLCIILRDSRKRMRDRIPDFLPDRFPTGMDLFPYTVSELERMKTESKIWYNVITTGVEV